MEKRNLGIPFRNGCSRNLFRGAIVDAGQKCNLKGEPCFSLKNHLRTMDMILYL